MADEQQEESTMETDGRPDPFAGYGGEDMPLAGYSGLVAGYVAGAGGTLALLRGRLPDRLEAEDIVLLGVATHKLSRMLAKDWVTSPLRAPFTRYRKSLGGGEVSEEARGQGMRRALGDLLTCPWCLGPWVATALAMGLVLAPRATRMTAATFSAVAISDFLHHAYDATKAAAQRETAHA